MESEITKSITCSLFLNIWNIVWWFNDGAAVIDDMLMESINQDISIHILFSVLSKYQFVI